MKPVHYKVQILFLSLWAGLVVVLFRLVQDRQTAAVIAGLGFILIPSYFSFFEVHRRNKRHLVLLGGFLLFSALPIFLMRLIYWGQPFGELMFLGVQMSYLHRLSNFLYLLMLASAIFGLLNKEL